MKLSQYAKQLGISYRSAWNMFKAGNIPNAYRLKTGAIIVPDSELLQKREDDVIENLINLVDHLSKELDGATKDKEKIESRGIALRGAQLFGSSSTAARRV